MSKIFILDTNVLLHDAKSILAFKDNEVVIPLVVLDELDKIKSGHDEKARNARMVIRTLDAMRSGGNLHNGVATADGGIIRVELNHQDRIPSDLDKNRADNRIISVALSLTAADKNREVIVVSKDINLRVKCDALGVNVEDYNTDAVAVDASLIYSGWTEIVVSPNTIDALYKDGFMDAGGVSLYPNQYVLLRSSVEPKHSCLAKATGQCLTKITPKADVWGISPRNKEQVFALDALFDPNIKLVTMTGKAGCGKTLLAAAAGVSQLLDSDVRNYKKLVMARPIQPMGRDIGYLPGDIDEKLKPWMMPLQDNLELLFSDKGLHFLEMQKETGAIEVEALTYIRGRSIPKSYIIIDESQNLTLHELKTVITRVGEGSKVVLTGDIHQIDNPYIDALDNGLSCIIEKFKTNPIAAHITLHRGERSELATIAAEIL